MFHPPCHRLSTFTGNIFFGNLPSIHPALGTFVLGSHSLLEPKGDMGCDYFCAGVVAGNHNELQVTIVVVQVWRGLNQKELRIVILFVQFW